MEPTVAVFLMVIVEKKTCEKCGGLSVVPLEKWRFGPILGLLGTI